MFNRLMCRTVFTEPDGIVREDVDGAQIHQRGHAQGIARIIRESQERRAVGNESAVKRNAVQNGRHAEFAHAVADVTCMEVARIQARRARPVGQV